MFTLTQTREEPPYKIRKNDLGWYLTKKMDFDGNVVEFCIGVFRSQPTAIAVMDADMSPETYPLYNDLREI